MHHLEWLVFCVYYASKWLIRKHKTITNIFLKLPNKDRPISIIKHLFWNVDGTKLWKWIIIILAMSYASNAKSKICGLAHSKCSITFQTWTSCRKVIIYDKHDNFDNILKLIDMKMKIVHKHWSRHCKFKAKRKKNPLPNLKQKWTIKVDFYVNTDAAKMGYLSKT